MPHATLRQAGSEMGLTLQLATSVVMGCLRTLNSEMMAISLMGMVVTLHVRLRLTQCVFTITLLFVQHVETPLQHLTNNVMTVTLAQEMDETLYEM